MSFKWKGLLGVGAAGFGLAGSSAATNAASSSSGAAAITLAEEDHWAQQTVDPQDLPNILGMDNFGNTCYVNSVLQALYLCDPFRESLLAYNLSAVKTPRGKPLGLPPTTPTQVTQQPRTPRAGEGEQFLSPPGKVATNDEARANTESLFYALRTLFQRMAVATTATTEPPQTPTASSSATSYLGGSLSRKVSSRPGTGSGVSASAAASQPVQQTGGAASNVAGPSATNGDGSANQCSNVVVSDNDIKAFLALLKKSNILFDSTAHQDAHELLNFILNRIGEDIVDEARADGRASHQQPGDDVHGVGSNGTTLVHRLFEGVLTNETRCLTCESITSRDESFLDLSLDIERNTSVTACLRQFSASEMLCARNKFFCDTCSGLQEAEKRMKIKKLPNVLALHLKRFKYEESVQRFVKLAYRVVFPMQLRLCNTSDDAQDPDKLYELYGIIVHIGVGPHHGHYIAIVKVGQRWFVFDDETISVIDAADIARYFGDTPGVGSAYVLFYQAVDLDMASLGLPDVKAMREEKAQLRREASVRRHLQQQQQQQNGNSNSLNGFALGLPPASAAMTTGGVEAFDPPSRSTTPSNEGRTGGGLFGRRQNSLSQQISAVSPGGSITTATPMTSSVPMSLSLSGEPNDGGGKGSGWLSSLRSRKPSAALSSPGGTTAAAAVVAGPPHSPIAQYKAQFITSSPVLGDADDDGDRGMGWGLLAAPNDGERRIPGSGTTSRQRSPARAGDLDGNDAPLPVSNSNGSSNNSGGGGAGLVAANSSASVSPAQGATFTPADRPLSKKEQDKIAKQSRRKGSVSLAHDAGSPSKPTATEAEKASTANGGVLPLGDSVVSPPPVEPLAGDLIPPSTSATGWRRVTNVGGGGGVARRPATADPSTLDQTVPSRRRSTLSRTFGFGRNKDKDKA